MDNKTWTSSWSGSAGTRGTRDRDTHSNGQFSASTDDSKVVGHQSVREVVMSPIAEVEGGLGALGAGHAAKDDGSSPVQLRGIGAAGAAERTGAGASGGGGASVVIVAAPTAAGSADATTTNVSSGVAFGVKGSPTIEPKSSEQTKAQPAFHRTQSSQPGFQRTASLQPAFQRTPSSPLGLSISTGTTGTTSSSARLQRIIPTGKTIEIHVSKPNSQYFPPLFTNLICRCLINEHCPFHLSLCQSYMTFSPSTLCLLSCHL